ncbi:MAG: hypothetical protein RhofKO_34660 [Rhodothermales bacterium]
MIRTYFLALFCLGLALPLQAQAPDNANQYLSDDDLSTAGRHRLTEMWALLPGWTGFAVDAYAPTVTPGALSLPLQPRWATFVDGHRIPLNVLGQQHLEALPLHVQQLGEIGSYTRPVYRYGQIRNRGLLDLRLRPIQDGWHAQGHVALGNEIDDPGPYRYVDPTLKNIDRGGPVAFVEVTGRSQRASIRASASIDEHHPTDPLVRRRLFYLHRDTVNPITRRQSALVQAAWRGGRSEHHLLAFYTDLQPYRWLPGTGAELPTYEQHRYIGLHGGAPSYRVDGLRYRLHYATQDYDPRTNRDQTYVDWRRASLHGSVDWTAGTPQTYATISASLDQHQQFDLDTTRTFITSGRITGLIHSSYANGMVRLSSEIERRLETSALRGVAEWTHFVDDANEVRTTLSYATRIHPSYTMPWYWESEGFSFYDRLALSTVNNTPTFTRGRFASADIVWRTTVGDAWIEGGGLFRYYTGLNVAQYRYSYTEEFTSATNYAFPATVQLRIGSSGYVAGGHARVGIDLVERLTAEAYYQYQRPVANDLAFYEAWAVLPQHQAQLDVRFAPLQRFYVALRGRFQSGTRWISFRPADDQTGGRFGWERPTYVLVDAMLTKHFWADHLTASLALRNVLNTPFRTHPAGAQEHMTLWIGITARI